MIPRRIFITHSSAFEQWDVRTPDERGIGQSETANIELAWRLAKRGWDVTCYAPIPDDAPREWRGTHWRTMEEIDYSQPGYWLIFRQPELMDKFDGDRADQLLTLVSQDEDYPGRWNDERAGKIDILFALCEAHKRSLESDHPALKGKVKVAANGIRMELIRDAEDAVKLLKTAVDDGVVSPELAVVRDPHRIMWASSPDRGLLRLLKIFRRLREYIPEASLHIAYGFNNIDVLTKMGPQFAWMQRAKDEIMKEAAQPGVYWLGRIPQPILMREWLKTGLIIYPSTFRETYPVHGDSLIETLRGPIPIKDLVGKELLVYSCSPDGKIGISSAKNATKKRVNAPVLTVTCRHGRGRNAKKEFRLTLTPDHEVMLVDGSYAQAGSLKVGDHVRACRRMPKGWGTGYATIAYAGNHIITKIEDGGTADVYCMEVEPDHNFIANGIVVHNCSTHAEAQALGAIPICSPVWAIGEHALAGSLIPGDPADPLIQSRFVSEAYRWMTQTQQADRVRQVMMQTARLAFSWERAVDLYESFLLGYNNGSRMVHSQFAFQLKHCIGGGKILNVGCADDPADLKGLGATNVDARKEDPIFHKPTKADVIFDVRALPAGWRGVFDKVVCGDMIEHFPVEAVPEILKKLGECLAPGGELILTIPDDHRPVDAQHAGSDGSHEYSDGVSAVHTHPIPRPMLDDWLLAAGLKIRFYQELECGHYMSHGVVCVESDSSEVTE